MLDQSGNDTQEYYGYIYVIVDQKYNKVYVGQKSGKIEESKEYYGSGTIIRRIKKIRGTYFLKKIILGVCYSRKELLECEYECKIFFNALDRRYGYNIVGRDDGGDKITNHPNVISIRGNMSEGAFKRFSKKEERDKQSERTKNFWLKAEEDYKIKVLKNRGDAIKKAIEEMDNEERKYWKEKRILVIKSKDYALKMSESLIKSNKNRPKEYFIKKAMKMKDTRWPGIDEERNKILEFMNMQKVFTVENILLNVKTTEGRCRELIKKLKRENKIVIYGKTGRTKMINIFKFC